MVNPTVDSETFVGSHEKANNSYGQNGDASASSLTPGQTKPNIKNVSPPTPVLPAHRDADTIGDRVHGSPEPHSHNAHPRTTSDGSPGGNAGPVTRPVKK